MNSQSLEKQLKRYQVVLMLTTVLLAGICSCKTTKSRIDKTTNTEASVAANVKQASEATNKTVTTEILTDKTTLADSVIVNIVDVVWSKPDSTGVQYPEKITYRNEVRTSKQKADVATDTQTKTDAVNKNENIDKSKAKNNIATDKTETGKTVIKTPMWIYAVAAVLSLGLLVLLYFVLRRFGLVK